MPLPRPPWRWLCDLDAAAGPVSSVFVNWAADGGGDLLIVHSGRIRPLPAAASGPRPGPADGVGRGGSSRVPDPHESAGAATAEDSGSGSLSRAPGAGPSSGLGGGRGSSEGGSGSSERGSSGGFCAQGLLGCSAVPLRSLRRGAPAAGARLIFRPDLPAAGGRSGFASPAPHKLHPLD